MGKDDPQSCLVPVVTRLQPLPDDDGAHTNKLWNEFKSQRTSKEATAVLDRLMAPEKATLLRLASHDGVPGVASPGGVSVHVPAA